MARIIIGICGAYFLVAGYHSFSGESFQLFLDFTYVKYSPMQYISLLVGGVMGFCWNLIAKESSGSE